MGELKVNHRFDVGNLIKSRLLEAQRKNVSSIQGKAIKSDKDDQRKILQAD
jgi:hypothetical protein